MIASGAHRSETLGDLATSSLTLIMVCTSPVQILLFVPCLFDLEDDQFKLVMDSASGIVFTVVTELS